jgi:putative FmdB family regulatory protein
MPTYEFRCPDGHDFEKFYRSISSAESEVACPVCGKISERIMSRSGFAFKGSGFYLTDYGKNAHRGTAPESKPSEGASSSPSGESKSDTKSESKSEASPPAAPKPSESKPSTPPSKPSSGE